MQSALREKLLNFLSDNQNMSSALKADKVDPKNIKKIADRHREHKKTNINAITDVKKFIDYYAASIMVGDDYLQGAMRGSVVRALKVEHPSTWKADLLIFENYFKNISLIDDNEMQMTDDSSECLNECIEGILVPNECACHTQYNMIGTWEREDPYEDYFYNIIEASFTFEIDYLYFKDDKNHTPIVINDTNNFIKNQLLYSYANNSSMLEKMLSIANNCRNTWTKEFYDIPDISIWIFDNERIIIEYKTTAYIHTVGKEDTFKYWGYPKVILNWKENEELNEKFMTKLTAFLSNKKVKYDRTMKTLSGIE